MKCKILEKASEMFLSLGFKSVTMDDISNELAISKKTLYTHFSTKKKLVESVSLYMFDIIDNGIQGICKKKQNPIEELFDIKRFVNNILKKEDTSPQYQLQKFYPDIFESLSKKQFNTMLICVKNNLERGIKDGLYRSDLNVDFISRIYFTGMSGIKNEDIYSKEQFNQMWLIDSYLEYHLRAITTEKGLNTLTQILNNNKD
ncbi:TetR family transcriptional regulator [Wenyingzhuangia fucanilytica]|uniref:TetR family transcriptional regulator n=1 Tax=Wenyingzhuangia fucanilytica TaxID=1790137 RepID=A0A1B1Y826_9FLAO|nr:TetR/AcrR family transcriptional regulator [Wenyingzhuangia fucanilytica]ANW96916.1 TetR family transcriptional regulator [Wenyingzhuangia fucanilytica]